MRIKLIFMSFFLLHAAVSVVHAKELKSFHEKLMASKSFGLGRHGAPFAVIFPQYKG